MQQIRLLNVQHLHNIQLTTPSLLLASLCIRTHVCGSLIRLAGKCVQLRARMGAALQIFLREFAGDLGDADRLTD